MFIQLCYTWQYLHNKKVQSNVLTQQRPYFLGGSFKGLWEWEIAQR